MFLFFFRVPFTYTLQARYLVSNPQQLSPVMLAAIIALKLLGLFVLVSVLLFRFA